MQLHDISPPVARRDMEQMNVPQAHNLTKGRSSIIIGILDTGVDATHPGVMTSFENCDSIMRRTGPWNHTVMRVHVDLLPRELVRGLFLRTAAAAAAADLAANMDLSRSASCIGGVLNKSPAAWDDNDGHGTW